MRQKTRSRWNGNGEHKAVAGDHDNGGVAEEQESAEAELAPAEGALALDQLSVAMNYTQPVMLMATDVCGKMVSVSLPINAVAEGEMEISDEPVAQSQSIVGSGIAHGDALMAGIGSSIAIFRHG